MKDGYKYWHMSEKLDGVRAVWDGATIRTRNGRAIAAPGWFIAALPPVAMTGELWAGRGTFQTTAGAVRRKLPLDSEWQVIRFHVFDMASPLPFPERMGHAAHILSGNPVAAAIPQRVCRGDRDAAAFFESVVAGGGEGIILRSPGGKIVKMKACQDDEGDLVRNELTITGGALVLAWRGELVRVSAGIPAEVRANPPRIGSKITFGFDGLTDGGKPRCPVFQSVRDYE